MSFSSQYIVLRSLEGYIEIKVQSCKLTDVSVETGSLLFCCFIKNGDQGNIENKLLRIIF